MLYLKLLLANVVWPLTEFECPVALLLDHLQTAAVVFSGRPAAAAHLLILALIFYLFLASPLLEFLGGQKTGIPSFLLFS